ncbi:MAG: hypothetical protein ACOC24_07655 [Desulfovibrionales bacterium]
MQIVIKNYEFSDDRTYAWVDIDIQDDPSHPSATARVSFAINVDPSHTIGDVDRVALEELQRFGAEIAAHLSGLQSLQ